jgi:hypothetical protein
MLLAVLLAAALDEDCAAQETISTLSYWNGSSYMWPFGQDGSATYGQTFVAPLANNFLNSMTFYLNDEGPPTTFGAYVMSWEVQKAKGPILYESPQLNTTNNGGAGGFETFTLNTGPLELTPGESYVAFFSVSEYFDVVLPYEFCRMGGLSDWNVGYADGRFVYLNNGGDPTAWTMNNWVTDHAFGVDLAFEMSFVPEPATMALLAAGLALLRRKRASEGKR